MVLDMNLTTPDAPETLAMIVLFSTCLGMRTWQRPWKIVAGKPCHYSLSFGWLWGLGPWIGVVKQSSTRPLDVNATLWNWINCSEDRPRLGKVMDWEVAPVLWPSPFCRLSRVSKRQPPMQFLRGWRRGLKSGVSSWPTNKISSK